MTPTFLIRLHTLLRDGPLPTWRVAHALATPADPVARIQLRLANWTSPFGVPPDGFVAECGRWGIATDNKETI